MNKAIIGRKLGMTQIFSADGKPALAGQNKVKQVVIPYRGAVIMPGGALLKPCVANLYIATDAFTVKE